MYVSLLVVAFIAAAVQVIVAIIWLKVSGDGPNSMSALKTSGMGRILRIARIVMVLCTISASIAYLFPHLNR